MTRGKRFNSPSALRPLPLCYIKVGELFTQQLFLLISVYNCPSLRRGATRGSVACDGGKIRANECRGKFICTMPSAAEFG